MAKRLIAVTLLTLLVAACSGQPPFATPPITAGSPSVGSEYNPISGSYPSP